MQDSPLSTTLLQQHEEVTRRHFLRLGATGLGAIRTLDLHSAESAAELLAGAASRLQYLTRQRDFGTVQRGNPLPYTLPLEKRLEIGLERETWKLEVVADPKSAPKLGNPLTLDKGNALDFAGLMKLAKTRAVRFLKVMTCNNMSQPLGMGLWEGVPLRDVLWLAKPTGNVRRVFYHGHHNEDPKQLFRSSLSIGRVLEDPPGDHPVILCYKLNGEWLSGKRGGPVRMLVPEAYGFKSVKWLKTITLTNDYRANDTYAGGNNDVDSRMKTMARFVHKPTRIQAGSPIPVTGLAQVGLGGLSKAQTWLHPLGEGWPEDDPHFTRAPWRDAEILPPPTDWGAELPDGKLPPDVRFFTKDGRPEHWPMRYTIAHWAALLKDAPAGKYELRCRSIDANGHAQPMPRPFSKSGANQIRRTLLSVEG